MNKYLDLINSELDKYMPDGSDVVSRAMRYSIENGGKRIRPTLVLEFCRLCGGDEKKALPLACAIEMIHTYSLIHDDLPCMDNDDYRRGKPSCHIAFGYEYALLAGDALLTLAFKTAAEFSLDARLTVEAIKTLADAAGWSGMVGGQVLDLQNEGKKVSLGQVEKTDELKTGELIRASCVMGCIAADRFDMIPYAEEYAKCIGTAFQIVDDILDVTSDAETLGKPIGSDVENEKCTYVSLMGIEKAKEYVSKLTEKAKKALMNFENDASDLADFADSMARRKS
ncbi:MAG: polyprenyl synthetase family protein [Clostridia bacterium]|nr:polyprenyl synthetase family protein [Clostridia bacterium]